MITLTFDDGWKSAKDKALSLLSVKKFKASFYVITDYLQENSYPEYIKRADILELYNQGHEIGSHTKSHSRLAAQLSRDNVMHEVRDSKDTLSFLGVIPQTFVYPYGDYSQMVVDEVKNAGYIGARTVKRGFNNTQSSPYFLKCQAVYRWTPLFLIKYWINKAERENSWLILMFHQIDNTYGFYGTTPKVFKKIIDYLSLKNIQTVTMAEGIKQLNLNTQDVSMC